MRADKMKAVLLISLMFTLALGEDFNKKPCQPAKKDSAYKTFLKRHILQKDFNRNSMDQWRDYLNKTGLCNRTTTYQTFIEEKNQKKVVEICKGSGRNTKKNFCISDSPIPVYHLTFTGKCVFSKPKLIKKYVIVSCDKIKNVCVPSHFDGVADQLPKGKLKPCK